MKFERMELLGVMVQDLDKAMALFGDLFDLEFEQMVFPDDIHFEDLPVGDPGEELRPLDGFRCAFDSSGFFELIERPEGPEGVWSIHYKVSDLDEAKERFLAKGLRLVREFVLGDARELVFASDNAHGVRIALLEYEGERLTDAMFQRAGSARSGATQPRLDASNA